MEHGRKSNGLHTFFEHWGLFLNTIIVIVLAQVLTFFINLTGAPWIWFCVASFAPLTAGGCLLTYAKFPTYRKGKFLTFGINSAPEHLKGFYRWGWRLFLFGVVLSLCLLLSRR